MSGLNKEKLSLQRQRWARAMEAVARECGKDSDVYYILGTLAWGRYDGEPQASGDKVWHVAYGWGFLQGVRYAALRAAERFKLRGEVLLRRIHEQIDEYEQEANRFKK